MKIKIYAYNGTFQEFDIPDDTTFLRVTMVTGDEVVEAYCRDPFWGDAFLSGVYEVDTGGRNRDFFDETYIVLAEDIEEWNSASDRRSRPKHVKKGLITGDELVYGE